MAYCQATLISGIGHTGGQGVPVFSTAGDAAALRLDDREGLLSVRSAALQPGARQIEFDDDGPAFVATLNVLSLRMFYSEL